MDNWHQLAIVESRSVGEGATIGAFAHILEGARIGRFCRIGDQAFIENDVTVADRVTIGCGVRLCAGATIEEDVYIGPNAILTNAAFRSPSADGPGTVVKKGASIGANATILPGLVIGEQALVDAGAVLTNNAPPHAILSGNPARITGYRGAAMPSAVPAHTPPAPGVYSTTVPGVTLNRLPLIDDVRGLLSFGEIRQHLPFEIKRYFLVFSVPGQHVRGEHAHRTLHQFLLCVHGRCHVMVDDGIRREEFLLDNPALGVHVPPMVWAVQYKYSEDAVLLVLASDFYDAADYIRDYSEFLALCQAPQAAGKTIP